MLPAVTNTDVKGEQKNTAGMMGVQQTVTVLMIILRSILRSIRIAREAERWYEASIFRRCLCEGRALRIVRMLFV